MGAAFARTVLCVTKPTVPLLNVGVEELKGSDAIKEADRMLREVNIAMEYKGFTEGDGIGAGEVDVVVTDGFTGNIALKTAEGTANFITGELRKAMTDSLIGKLSSLLNISNLRKFKARLDPRLYNGAIFIGLDSPVIKSHGGTDYIGFSNSLSVCTKTVNNNLIEKITNNIK